MDELAIKEKLEINRDRESQKEKLIELFTKSTPVQTTDGQTPDDRKVEFKYWLDLFNQKVIKLENPCNQTLKKGSKGYQYGAFIVCKDCHDHIENKAAERSISLSKILNKKYNVLPTLKKNFLSVVIDRDEQQCSCGVEITCDKHTNVKSTI